MAATPTDDAKPNYTNDETGDPKPPAPLPWTPPGGLNRRNVRRGRWLGKRRPR